ncbi:hypothetical protein FHU29_003857 [Hoyosella altamirensis]|uniref:Uncharacterized protein n=1 Tax=Hoyosella altamirensis TaxID=616997 RepID=A0A839RT42_9ACTN|nr:hypothetical protein [Hoyosella altamirensis]
MRPLNEGAPLEHGLPVRRSRQAGARDVRMVRALRMAAVFAANINSPPFLAIQVRYGRLKLTRGKRSRQRIIV